ncbi:uncharacterized protein BO72DRAFT_485920 [Aspergillus fijiensis CBS 313.89]|uniref:TNFR-Cys domain-containing protein n=1 Tax=Aspergillus fijiensis CBS 313.89 TaxID=1448319 RepID=A0A8G1RT52_9EURO|nr:uncharacterized protein BO72DRAFT_485920 [Aspergillus fijiensis CBS 313.89]RAK77380.1 hypothetical protein BO72DRAFT_485920 [Aspergillus fijiensis CBS 313.89]
MKIFNILTLASGAAAILNNQGCLEWCSANFGLLSLATCYTPSIFGNGPCFECGPRKSIPTKKLCSKKCVDLNTDNYNCGKCGKKCNSGSTCDKGICRPQANCQAKDRCSLDPPCPDKTCICQPDERGGGKGYCNKGDWCVNLKDCQSIKDCPIEGSVCLTTCCSGSAKCMPPDKLCAKTVSRIFRPREVLGGGDVDEVSAAAAASGAHDRSEEGHGVFARQEGEFSSPIRPGDAV